MRNRVILFCSAVIQVIRLIAAEAGYLHFYLLSPTFFTFCTIMQSPCFAQCKIYSHSMSSKSTKWSSYIWNFAMSYDWASSLSNPNHKGDHCDLKHYIYNIRTRCNFQQFNFMLLSLHAFHSWSNSPWERNKLFYP